MIFHPFEILCFVIIFIILGYILYFSILMVAIWVDKQFVLYKQEFWLEYTKYAYKKQKRINASSFAIKQHPNVIQFKHGDNQTDLIVQEAIWNFWKKPSTIMFLLSLTPTKFYFCEGRYCIDGHPVMQSSCLSSIDFSHRHIINYNALEIITYRRKNSRLTPFIKVFNKNIKDIKKYVKKSAISSIVETLNYNISSKITLQLRFNIFCDFILWCIKKIIIILQYKLQLK